jgi:hypothetical protein
MILLENLGSSNRSIKLYCCPTNCPIRTSGPYKIIEINKRNLLRENRKKKFYMPLNQYSNLYLNSSNYITVPTHLIEFEFLFFLHHRDPFIFVSPPLSDDHFLLLLLFLLSLAIRLAHFLRSTFTSSLRHETFVLPPFTIVPSLMITAFSDNR